MAANPRPPLTTEDYLALERVSSTRSEYLNGQIYARAGGSPAHNILAGNLITLLNSALRPRRCIAFPSDQQVHVAATGFYGYPDGSLVYGRPRHDRHGDSLENPIVLVEVLSPSTEGYDRGQKFAHYRRIDSLQDYLLVSQEESRLDRFTRHPDNSWRLTEAVGLETTLHLDSVGCSLVLTDVYSMVWDEGEASEQCDSLYQYKRKL